MRARNITQAGQDATNRSKTLSKNIVVALPEVFITPIRAIISENTWPETTTFRGLAGKPDLRGTRQAGKPDLHRACHAGKLDLQPAPAYIRSGLRGWPRRRAGL